MDCCLTLFEDDSSGWLSIWIWLTFRRLESHKYSFHPECKCRRSEIYFIFDLLLLLMLMPQKNCNPKRVSRFALSRNFFFLLLSYLLPRFHDLFGKALKTLALLNRFFLCFFFLSSFVTKIKQKEDDEEDEVEAATTNIFSSHTQTKLSSLPSISN